MRYLLIGSNEGTARASWTAEQQQASGSADRQADTGADRAQRRKQQGHGAKLDQNPPCNAPG